MDLRNQQIKETYGNLATINTVAGTPTTGVLQNGAGSNVTAMTLEGSLTAQQLNADNLRLDGNTISSTDTNGNITIDPNGTGSTIFGGDVLIDDKIIHSGDTNTAIRFPSADTVTVETAGSERMRIDSGGDLTIKGGRIIVRESDDGNDAVVITRDADEGYVNVFSSGVQKVEIRGNGDSYFNGGNVGIGTSSPAVKLDVSGQVRASTGILFGTDTAAANALDDYEEGTFTPVIADGYTAAGNTGTASTATGKYTKIGQFVHVQIYLAGIDTTGMTSGNAIHIINLPFAIGSGAIRVGVLGMSNITTSADGFYAFSNTTAGSRSFFRLFQKASSTHSAILVSAISSGTGEIIVDFTYQV